MEDGVGFIVLLSQKWSETNEIDFHYIQPGKSTENEVMDRPNKSLPRSCTRQSPLQYFR